MGNFTSFKAQGEPSLKIPERLIKKLLFAHFERFRGLPYKYREFLIIRIFLMVCRMHLSLADAEPLFYAFLPAVNKW